MLVQYTNRIGKIYYLREGKTKSGKPRYFFSSQEDGKGDGVDHIPIGYEIYEHPENAQVFLRKKRPQLTTDIERKFVKNRVDALKRSRRYRVDFKDKYITIYESDIEFEDSKNVLGDTLRKGSSYSMNALMNVADRQYTAVLRFHLDDDKQRTFTAERFCFRGAIDDWIFLDGPDNLKKLVEKYIDIIGTDDFFDAPFL